MWIKTRTTILVSILLIGGSVLLFLLNRNAVGDYEAFARVIAEKPRSYTELDQLMQKHVYDYSDQERNSYLGKVEPLKESEESRLNSGREIVFYDGKNAKDVSFQCHAYTFQTDTILFWTIQSLAQTHRVYFDKNLRIVGYHSDWLAHDDESNKSEIATPSRPSE